MKTLVTYHTILEILEAEGIIINTVCDIRDIQIFKKMEDAVNGKPVLFLISCTNIGRCYNRYCELVVNYDPSMDNHPASNWGKVKPKEVKTVYGVNVALFDYSVDSSD